MNEVYGILEVPKGVCLRSFLDTRLGGTVWEKEYE